MTKRGRAGLVVAALVAVVLLLLLLSRRKASAAAPSSGPTALERLRILLGGSTAPKSSSPAASGASSWASERLSANFTGSEFGDVPAAHQAAVRALVRYVLQPMRDAAGVPLRVTSGYRTVAHNTDVGGSPTSQHLTAAAADVSTGSAAGDRRLFSLGLQGKIRWRPGQVIFYPHHPHIHAASPGTTYRSATFQVHHPARGLSYRRVRTVADLVDLGY